MVKFSGELDVPKSGYAVDPDPVQMAPLKSPSMDCELPTARRICGCAGRVTVIGTCAMGRMGAAAMTGSAAAHSMAAAALRKASPNRRPMAVGVCLLIVNILAICG